MAKKRKKTKHHPRRRMGAVSGSTSAMLQTLGGVVVGAIAKGFVDSAIAKQTTVKIDDKMLQAGEAVAGALLAYKAKSGFLKGIGMGLAASAVVAELKDMKVLTGLGIGTVNPASLTFQAQRGLNGPGKSQTIFPSVGQAVSPGAVGGAMYAGVYD